MMLPAILKTNGGRTPSKNSSIKSGYFSTDDSVGEFTDWKDGISPNSSKKFAFATSTMKSRSFATLDDKLNAIGTVCEAEVSNSVVGYFGKEQYLINKELKDAVTDLQMAAEGMHMNHLERCIAMKADTNTIHDQIFKELERYQHQMKWDTPVGIGVPEVCQEMNLLTNARTLEELGSPIHIPPIYALVPTLNELLVAVLRPVRLEQVMELLREIIVPLAGQDDLVEQVRQVHKMVHTDVLKLVAQELSKTQPLLVQLHRELDLTERERQMALQLNNIPEATEKHLKSVDILENLIEIIRARLHELMMGSGDPQAIYNLLGGLRKGMIDDLQALKAEKEKLKDMLQSDIANMKDGLRKKERDDDANAEEAKKRLDTNADRLQQNMMQQDTVWNQVLEMMERLKTLGEDHSTLVNRHMQLVEDEAKRLRAANEFSDVATDHLAYLCDALKHSDAALMMISAIEDYFNQATENIREKHIEEQLEVVKLKEMRHYYEVFRKYGLIAGDLLDRKEKRLTGVKKLLRNLDFGTEMAVEALDDDCEKYEQDAKDFRRRADQLHRDVVRLKNNLECATNDFQATEEMLDEAGIEFKPPEVEMQEFIMAKKKSFLEKRRAVLYDDQKELDTGASELRKLDSQVRTRLDVVAERRDAIKARKNGGRTPSAASPTAAPHNDGG